CRRRDIVRRQMPGARCQRIGRKLIGNSTPVDSRRTPRNDRYYQPNPTCRLSRVGVLQVQRVRRRVHTVTTRTRRVKLSIRFVVAVAAIAGLPQIAFAQDSDPIGKWFSDRKIAVRRTFDGGKDEQNPASLFLVRDPGGQDKESASIDIALKTTEKEWKPSSGSLLFYPVFDYHRSTNSAQLLHKMGAAGRFEYQLNGSSVAPVFLLDAKASHDWAIYRNEARVGLQFFLKSKQPGFPGSDNAKSWGFYRYYAYLGGERDWFEAAGDDTTIKVGYARAWVEVWPSFAGTEFLQLTVDA